MNKPIIVALLLGTMTIAACSKSSDETAAPAASDAAAASNVPAPAPTASIPAPEASSAPGAAASAPVVATPTPAPPPADRAPGQMGGGHAGFPTGGASE